jgi:hypothetical protein
MKHRTTGKTIGISLVFLLLSGCVATPTQQEIATAYYGEPPTMVFQEVMIKSLISSMLKDPDSAKFQFGEPYKNYVISYRDGKTEYGWIVKVAVNAKNSFGGYTGYQTYTILVRDEKMILGYGPDERSYYKEGVRS